MAGFGGIGIIGQLIATLGLNTMPFMKGLQDANKAMLGWANAGMMMGRTMTRFVTLPLAIAGATAVNTQKKFEASMTKITSLVGVSRNQVQAWTSEVLKMSKVTGRGPEELADALYFVTSAGMRGADAMEVLEMSAKASAAGLGETKVVADLVTSAINAYGRENLSAADATDILVAAVREGKAEADALAGAMGMVLPIASEFGVTFDQVGAAFAAMTRTGTNARVAATQLKAILVGMASPAMEAEKAMSSFGTSADEFRKTVREEGLIQALLDLRQATVGNEKAMSQIFPNVRALMGVLDMLGANVEYNKQIFESLKNSGGSLERAFAEVAGTTQQKLNVAMATFKATLVSVGEALKPFVVKHLARLNDMLARSSRAWEGMTEGQRKFKVATIGATAAMGPFFVIASRIIALFSIPKLRPWLLAATALIALTTAIIHLVRKSRELDNIQKKSEENMAATTRQIVREQVAIDKLSDTLKNAEKGTKEWNDARDRLHGSYSQYISDLDEEKASSEELTASLEKLKEVKTAEMKIEAGKAEIGRLESQAEDMVTTAFKGIYKVVDGLADELATKSKFPEEFAVKMEELIKEAGDRVRAGENMRLIMADMSDEFNAEFDEYIGQFLGHVRASSLSTKFQYAIIEAFNKEVATGKQISAIEKSLEPYQEEYDNFVIDRNKQRVIDIDFNVDQLKESAGLMKESERLQNILNLLKEKQGIIGEGVNAELDAEVKKTAEELAAQRLVDRQIGYEEKLRGRITALEEERKHLSEGQLEANSKATRQAERDLAILQNNTSGLGEIEKLRNRIAIEKEASLELSGEELAIAMENITASERLLELMEARAAGYNTLTQKEIELAHLKEDQKKLEGDAAVENARSIGILEEEITLGNMQEKLMENQVSQLGDYAKLQNEIAIKKAVLGQYSDEERKVQEELIRQDEQRAAYMRAYIDGLGELGQKEIELAQMKEDQSKMDVEAAAEQQKKIDKKAEEVRLDQETIAGYNEWAKLQHKISQDESNLLKLSGEKLKLAQNQLLADRIRELHLRGQNDILTEQEARELKILETELKRLKFKWEDEGRDTSEIDKELRQLRLEDDILSDIEDKRTGKAAPREGSIAHFKQIFAAFKEIKKLRDSGDISFSEWFDKFNEGLHDLATAVNATFQTIGGIIKSHFDNQAAQLEAQKQRELSAAGDNAEKRKAIEKKYFKEQQKMAVKQAIINTALAVGNASTTVPFIPAGIIAMGIAAAAGAVQIGIIKAQKFAKGGIVSGRTLAQVAEYPGAKANPEVIAPLSDLKKYMRREEAAGPPKEIILKMRGRDAYAIIQTQDLLNNTY